MQLIFPIRIRDEAAYAAGENSKMVVAVVGRVCDPVEEILIPAREWELHKKQ